MKQMKLRLVTSLVVGAANMMLLAPGASAVEVRVTTLQERADEVVEIENDVVESCRALQRRRFPSKD